jgi:hypothetical protein
MTLFGARFVLKQNGHILYTVTVNPWQAIERLIYQFLKLFV